MLVIYHNPECGTSRNALKIIQDAGYSPIVIEYLKDGWTGAQLLGLFAAAKSPAAELGLLADTVSDQEILEAMIQHPILVNRPIVCSPQGVKLCRPSEVVLDLLESWPKGPYYKEDGEQILNIDGTRTSPVP